MGSLEDFTAAMRAVYAFPGVAAEVGCAVRNGECPPGAIVRIPLRTMNRHGLITGASGTGKTKSLQVIAVQLSLHGVPTLLMDIKGDLSGIAAPAATDDGFLRHEGMDHLHGLRRGPGIRVEREGHSHALGLHPGPRTRHTHGHSLT